MKVNKLYIITLYILLAGFIATACSDDKTDNRMTGIELTKRPLVNGQTGIVVKLNDGPVTIEASALPANIGTQLIFKGGADDLFTVTSNGVLTPIKQGIGALVIQADDESGYFQSYYVEVRVDGLSLTEQGENLEVQQGRKVDLAKEVQLAIDEDLDQTVLYEVANTSIASVTADGQVSGLQLGETTIKVTSKAQPQYTQTANVRVTEYALIYEDLSRQNWTSTQSHLRPVDAAITNAADSHIDSDFKTCLSLVKAGKDYDGVKVAEGESVFFVVDMLTAQKFNYMRFRHRDGTVAARIHGVSVFGSNDGVAYEPVAENVDLPSALDGSQIETENTLFDEAEYRYVKIEYKKWDTATRATVQLAEFYLGLKY